MKDKDYLYENTQPDSGQAAQDAEMYQDLELVIGDSTVLTRQLDPESRRRRHMEMYQRHRKRMIILGCILSALAILFSVAWYFYSPLYGYGDLSENIDSDRLNRARSRFVVEEYNDKKEGITLTYNIFIPYEYDQSKHFPAIFCLADSASVGLDTKKPLRDNFGGAVWATALEQQKHPCFVIVPCYPEEVTGHGVGVFTRYTDLTARLMDYVVSKYRIDATEVHAAGQGMGASMLMYLAADESDRFSSLLLVDGGAEIPSMTDLSDSRFIFIASAGDSAAMEAQQLVQQNLRASGADYGEMSELDAEAPIDELNAAVSELLEQDHDRNFITWKSGSVGFSLFVGEQRMSYRFGYRSDAVRDWIMQEQDRFQLI